MTQGPSHQWLERLKKAPPTHQDMILSDALNSWPDKTTEQLLTDHTKGRMRFAFRFNGKRYPGKTLET